MKHGFLILQEGVASVNTSAISFVTPYYQFAPSLCRRNRCSAAQWLPTRSRSDSGATWDDTGETGCDMGRHRPNNYCEIFGNNSTPKLRIGRLVNGEGIIERCISLRRRFWRIRGGFRVGDFGQLLEASSELRKSQALIFTGFEVYDSTTKPPNMSFQLLLSSKIELIVFFTSLLI